MKDKIYFTPEFIDKPQTGPEKFIDGLIIVIAMVATACLFAMACYQLINFFK